MKKFVIGLFLARELQKGGAYQYALSIIRALESFNVEKFKIFVFYQNKVWEQFLPVNFEKCFFPRPLINTVFNWLYMKIDRSINSHRRFTILCNPIVKKVNNSLCDLVVFADQDLESYQIKKRSLVPIHDLMHRYEPHFDEYKGKYYNEREMHYMNICKYSTGILVDSEVGKKHVAESYNRKKDTIYVLSFVPPYYLLDYKIMNVMDKYRLPENYLFYPAQFWQHKNHENLIKAISVLKNKGKNIFMVLTGEKKNYYDKIIDLIETYNLKENIIILGYVPDEDMRSLYKNALALIYVSLIGPTNIPPLEAMLLGCPVICSNKYAMPEQLGNAALFINPNDPNDIANKILQLIQNKSFREVLIEKGYSKIKEYDQKSFTKCLEKIILKILS